MLDVMCGMSNLLAIKQRRRYVDGEEQKPLPTEVGYLCKMEELTEKSLFIRVYFKKYFPINGDFN